MSAAALAPEWMRSTPAPSVAATPAWSTRKFELRAAAGASPVTSSSGVRALAASVSPVSAFVNPGPWWTLHTPTRPLTRAYPSAMQIAPFSWRAWWNAAPAACSACVARKFPLPSTPKASRTPSSASVRPTASAAFTGGRALP